MDYQSPVKASDALKRNNFFEGVTLIIICPIVGMTVFVRTIEGKNYIEVFENLIGGAAINNLLTDEERETPFNGIYTKDILFGALSLVFGCVCV